MVTNRQMKDIVSRMVPTITYGANGTTVISAELSTKQDQLLAASQMLSSRISKANTITPNGSDVGGMPLKITPTILSMTTHGCPLLQFMQLFFVDFNTGTTADNIYGITGLTHSLTPGKFTTQMTLTFYDSFGKYESDQTVSSNILSKLEIATTNAKKADDAQQGKNKSGQKKK